MVGRGELPDKAWERIAALLPVTAGGRSWRDHRQVINAIPVETAHRRTPAGPGPERYGPWKTDHERMRRWSMDGAWQKILDEAIVKDDAVGEVE